MGEINLGRNIVRFRKRDKITQEQLAEFMGVSKSSVSKWETQNSFPDICLLPSLASLFDVTVDELMGYEPQLDKDRIRSLYHELAEKMGENPKDTFKECRELIKTYYSCFPFLYQMALLLVNHLDVAENKEEILTLARVLCERIKKQSGSSRLIKDSVQLEAVICMMSGDFKGVQDILGQEPQPLSQEAELIGASYQNMGNIEKAKEINQICIYQHLLYFLQDSVNYMNLNSSDSIICDETMKRIEAVIDLCDIETVHSYTAVQFYFSAAGISAQKGEVKKALKWLAKMTKVIQKTELFKELCTADFYFDKVGEWVESMELGTAPPRGKDVIKQSMLEAVKSYPAFQVMKSEESFQRIIEQLEGI